MSLQRHSVAGVAGCAALVALALTMSPLLADDGRDSLTDQVVRMLDAELSEEIVLEWLQNQPLAAAPLTADELVALKSAGASDDLMKELMALTRRQASGEASTPDASSSIVAAPKPETPAGLEASRSSSVPSLDSTDPPVTFRLSYLIRRDEWEVGDEGPEWNLFVYIDGYPMTYMTSAEIENRPAVLEFARTLPAGEHTIRVLQERHHRKKGGWQHESRVARREFDFELDPEAPARLEVEFHERLTDYQDPLTFKLTQGARVVDTGRSGGDAEYWPALCDDIEVSVAGGKKPNRRQRQQLESCLRWQGLWGERAVPSRQEVLDAMARFEFKPTPKGS